MQPLVAREERVFARRLGNIHFSLEKCGCQAATDSSIDFCDFVLFQPFSQWPPSTSSNRSGNTRFSLHDCWLPDSHRLVSMAVWLTDGEEASRWQKAGIRFVLRSYVVITSCSSRLYSRVQRGFQVTYVWSTHKSNSGLKGHTSGDNSHLAGAQHTLRMWDKHLQRRKETRSYLKGLTASFSPIRALYSQTAALLVVPRVSKSGRQNPQLSGSSPVELQLLSRLRRTQSQSKKDKKQVSGYTNKLLMRKNSKIKKLTVVCCTFLFCTVHFYCKKKTSCCGLQ